MEVWNAGVNADCGHDNGHIQPCRWQRRQKQQSQQKKMLKAPLSEQKLFEWIPLSNTTRCEKQIGEVLGGTDPLVHAHS